MIENSNGIQCIDGECSGKLKFDNIRGRSCNGEGCTVPVGGECEHIIQVEPDPVYIIHLRYKIHCNGSTDCLYSRIGVDTPVTPVISNIDIVTGLAVSCSLAEAIEAYEHKNP